MGEYLMRQATPPHVGGGRKQTPLEGLEERRQQMLDNPNTWFVWYENAIRYQLVNKVLRQLMGVGSNAPLNRKEWSFKGATRKNQDGSYTIYVGYFPESEAVKP